MIAELGHFALILALVVALAQGILPLIGAMRGNVGWMTLGVSAARAQFVLLLLSYIALSYAFYVNDFSLVYVAENSNTALPWYYRLSAVWGAHEGSLLLWVLILAGWGMAVSYSTRALPMVFSARVMAVMGLVSVGFLLFMLLTSNPFDRLFPAAAEGRDLNPLLQDFGLIVHPPMLYMGYVGFSVAFSFAIAALLGGNLDATWARWSRPWTTVAWVFLTLGIAMGSWWAYYELGWGGWWFWDPVENASFMPWLVGTALIHSLAVTEKRGTFKSWTVLLAISTFSLSLLGTFLVRSGVLTSVHSFATDPTRGMFILALLVITVGVSLLLYAIRAPKVGGGGSFGLFSRESMLLINNVLLTVGAATVLLGTLYPLITDALGLGKISVGEPYFNAVFIPLMIPLIILTAFGPLLRWKQDQPSRVFKGIWAGGVVVLIAAVVFAITVGPVSPMAAFGLVLAVWVAYGSFQSLWERTRNRRSRWRALQTTSRGIYGMVLAHLGLAVFIVGVTVVSTFEVERDLRMAPGDTLQVRDYVYRFDGVRNADGPNYRSTEGVVTVLRNGKEVTVLYPEKRLYLARQMPMTEAGINAGLFRDLYVSLGEPLSNGAWGVRVYYKPYVRWIWLGSLMMAAGGLLAATDPRYRRLLAKERQVRSAAVYAEGSA